MRALLLCTLAVAMHATAGCTTTDHAMRMQLTAWIGQPVRAFAEQHSLTPDDVYTRPDGTRAYLFQKRMGYGQCGVTIVANKGASEWMIAEMQSSCPPGTL